MNKCRLCKSEINNDSLNCLGCHDECTNNEIYIV